MTTETETQSENSYQAAVKAMNEAALLKEKKLKKEEEEELEEKGQIRVRLPNVRYVQQGASSKSEAAMEMDAADDIDSQIAKHKQLCRSQTGIGRLDAERPVGAGNTEDNSRMSGRIIAANSHFVAIVTGREIEIHQLEKLMPNMKYDGKDPWHSAKEILVVGNVLELKYKGGIAEVATVREHRQERQQELVKQRGLQR